MRYPTVNYIGNKEKIVAWISSLLPFGASSLLDAFAGGCSVAYMAKAKGLQVFVNDILKIDYHLARALIENADERLTLKDVEMLFGGTPFSGFMCEHFANRFYFEDECRQLDLFRKNIDQLSSEYKRSLAWALMRRAMIRKMPYSRFTINWEKTQQLRDEQLSYALYGRRRAYHNQSFRFHFEKALGEYNAAVFDNGQQNRAYNQDVFEVLQQTRADIVYLDPPYAGTMNDYHAFYGLLDSYITGTMSEPFANNFMDKKNIGQLFDRLFANLGNFKYWMLSYNSRSKPTKEELLQIIRKYTDDVTVHEMPYAYRVTGKEKKKKDTEYLFIAKNKDYGK